MPDTETDENGLEAERPQARKRMKQELEQFIAGEGGEAELTKSGVGMFLGRDNATSRNRPARRGCTRGGGPVEEEAEAAIGGFY